MYIYIYKIYVCFLHIKYYFLKNIWACEHIMRGTFRALKRVYENKVPWLKFSPLILALVCLQKPKSWSLYCLFSERIRTRIQKWFKYNCSLFCLKNNNISNTSTLIQLEHQHISVNSLIWSKNKYCILLDKNVNIHLNLSIPMLREKQMNIWRKVKVVIPALSKKLNHITFLQFSITF